jgi:hypothetical protein
MMPPEKKKKKKERKKEKIYRHYVDREESGNGLKMK